MKKSLIIVPAIFVLLYISLSASGILLIFQSPEAACTDFLDTTDQAEDMLIDPLILAGESVVFLVVKEIKSPNMKLRRYAIHFLGNGKYKQAVPALKEILASENELDYFRGDVLASIRRHKTFSSFNFIQTLN